MTSPPPWQPPPEHAAATPPVPAGPTGPEVVNTQNTNLGDGVNRCPRCGSTDIQLRASTGMLVCLFCRHEWNEQKAQGELFDDGDLTQLRGTQVGSGAANIDANANAVVTLKCQGCGAEVVVNTEAAMSSRCHWCRHVLTINNQVPNGAVPDAVLPFAVSHEDAVARITEFANKRKTFANRQFLKEFTPRNVVGVYMPYMVVDGNVSSDVYGYGEVETRRYTRGSGDDRRTYYDADVYQIHRHVDFTVDDLTIESSAERANMDTRVNTNNIINTILPFDTTNAVRWNANYLNGFSSEKRDQDVDQLRPALENQLLSIARSQVAPATSRYDRGVRWESEGLDVHGTRWVSMYLPVWLYSYFQKDKNMVHYIAVNGRTGETMGSIPVAQGRLLAVSAVVGVVVEAIAIVVLVVS